MQWHSIWINGLSICQLASVTYSFLFRISPTVFERHHYLGLVYHFWHLQLFLLFLINLWTWGEMFRSKCSKYSHSVFFFYFFEVVDLCINLHLLQNVAPLMKVEQGTFYEYHNMLSGVIWLLCFFSRITLIGFFPRGLWPTSLRFLAILLVSNINSIIWSVP